MYPLKNKNLLEAIIEASNDSIAIIDLTGNILFVSEKVNNLFGITNSDSLINTPVFGLIAESERKKASKTMSKRISGHNIGNLEYTGIKKDGELFDLEINGKVVMDSNNKPECLLYIFRDISENKMLKSSLKTEENNYQRIIEVLEENERLLNVAQQISRSGSFEIDFGNNAVNWSANNYRILGFEPFSIKPSNELFDSLVYPEDAPKLTAVLEEFKKIPKPSIFEYEYRIKQHGAGYKWFKTYAESIFINGKFKGIRGTNIDIHDKKITELENTSQNQKFNAILEATPDLIFIYDINGICLDYFSDSDKTTFIPKDRIIGSSLYDVFPLEMADEHLRNINKAIQTGKIVTNEYNLAGEENFFEARMTRLNENSSLIFIRDISAQKIAEKKSAEIQKRQKLQADISHLINISKNIAEDTGPLLELISKYYSNSCVYLLFDESISEISKKSSSLFCTQGLVCADEFENIYDYLRELIKEETNEFLQFYDITGIKSLLAAPLFSENIKIGYFGLLNSTEIIDLQEDDIELFKLISNSLSNAFERYLILKKLETNTLLLNHFIEIAKEGHFDIDVEKHLVKYNETGAKMLGYNFEEIKVRDYSFWKQIINKEDYSDFSQLFLKCIEGELNIFESVIRIKSGDGEWRWIMMRGNVVKRDENNLAQRIMGIQVDITNQKNTEELLKSTLKNRDKLFSIIAHDLRGPIHNLIPMLEMYSDITPENYEKGLDLIADIKKSVQNTADLLDNLLSWARIQSKTLNFSTTSFILIDVVNEIVTLYSSMADFKKITIEVNICKDITVEDDINSARLVIRNIVNNALKYTPNGGKIIIEAYYERENVLIKISDTGVGMSEEMINNFYDSKLFESTYGTKNEKGTGLGLALCKDTIENNEGSIDVYSKPGEGTRFEFTLKRGTYSKDSSAATVISKNKIGLLQNKKILLVEDDSFSQLYGKNILTKWNTIVDIADNGQIALEILKESQFDIILMDLEMPVLDGFSTIKAIKDDLLIQTPIIAFSSNISEETRTQALKSGSCDYIIKPSNPAELFTKIVKWLNLSAEDQFISTNSKGTTKTNSICDWNKLTEALGEDNDAICQIISKFLEVTPAYYEEVVTSYEKREFETLKNISHKFKSSISLIAINTIIDNIQAINNLAKNPSNENQFEPLIKFFKQWYPQLCEELKEGLIRYRN